MARLARLLLIAVAATAATVPAAWGADSRSSVLVTTVAGPITPVIDDHLRDAIERATADGHEALIIRLDTPGGLDSSMRSIVQNMLEAEVPVVVHVAPRGARAASAGALITFAADVAAMAPGTAIGAATPVEGGSGEDAERKAKEDARAFAASVAEAQGRNVEFAIDTVEDARSASAAEASEIGAVDLIAEDTDALLAALDGREVELPSGTSVRLDTEQAVVTEYDLSLPRQILQFLADPNLAFLFLSIGTLGLIYELASPGMGAAGGLGLVMVLLALFSLSVLPVNAVGFAFLVLAVGLFVAELFAPGVGVFAVLGAGALVLSGLFLFSESAPGIELHVAAILPTAIVTGILVVLAGRLALRARARPPILEPSHLVGRDVQVATVSGDTAQTRVEGSWWRLRAPDHTLRVGETARVVDVDVDHLDLVVTPTEPTAGHQYSPHPTKEDEVRHG